MGKLVCPPSLWSGLPVPCMYMAPARKVVIQSYCLCPTRMMRAMVIVPSPGTLAMVCVYDPMGFMMTSYQPQRGLLTTTHINSPLPFQAEGTYRGILDLSETPVSDSPLSTYRQKAHGLFETVDPSASRRQTSSRRQRS